VISISRAEGPLRLPAEFQLLLASNACPCGRLGIRKGRGYYGSHGTQDDSESDGAAFGKTQDCLCSSDEIYRYWRKLGGALLDRIELRVPVVPPDANEIGKPQHSGGGESSADIARRVARAVEVQRQRGGGLRRNASIPVGKIDEFCPMSERGQAAFHKALARLGLSGRAYHGILRVARTIADLEGSEVIDTAHVLEAVQHRRYGEDPYEILTAG